MYSIIKYQIPHCLFITSFHNTDLHLRSNTNHYTINFVIEYLFLNKCSFLTIYKNQSIIKTRKQYGRLNWFSR